MKNKLIALIVFFALSLSSIQVFAQQQRFPKPEFEEGHTQPETLMPEPRANAFEIIDLFVLIAALSLVSWLLIKKRSRKGIFLVSIFSMLYFGFFREGCICSVGSIQNVALAIFNPAYSIPISALLFFTIPLIFTLFYGRTFCAAVCPLGAIQDLVALKPLKLKRWVQKIAGLIPFLYLGLSILYTVTETDFIICRYDPFIGIFRFSGEFFMIALGVLLLITGIFIARPYCRFLCPYGVILNLISRFSKYHVSITPKECIQCRLCEESCPYDAINMPNTEKIDKKNERIKKYLIIGALLPFMVALGTWTGSKFHKNLASIHPKIQLLNELTAQNPNDEPSFEITAFRTSGKTEAQLGEEVKAKLKQFHTGSMVLGAFMGLVFGISLLNLSTFRYQTDYTPDKGNCLSCGRCMDYCPIKAD